MICIAVQTSMAIFCHMLKTFPIVHSNLLQVYGFLLSNFLEILNLILYSFHFPCLGEITYQLILNMKVIVQSYSTEEGWREQQPKCL